jgi:hypothetical protein
LNLEETKHFVCSRKDVAKRESPKARLDVGVCADAENDALMAAIVNGRDSRRRARLPGHVLEAFQTPARIQPNTFKSKLSEPQDFVRHLEVSLLICRWGA